jgi:hypothetical protein
MRPHPEELVRILQSGVVSHFAPELQSNYARAQFGFGALLFGLATRGIDTAVPDLIDENATLRSLLDDAADALAKIEGDHARAGERTIAAVPARTDSLRLSALRTENDALRSALSSLAPLIEAAGEEPGLLPLRDVRAAAYAHLQSNARKRIVPILSA